MKIWLASGSPRRRDLLVWCGAEVLVRPAGIDETLHPGEDPVAYAERLAAGKADSAPMGVLALAADTVVHRDGRVYDKPADRAEAAATLRELSGTWHVVTTGFCVRGADRVVGHTSTQVRFRPLSDTEIAAYVATGEADDKAGAYGIQGRGGVFVAEVLGSWTNVMGLPVESVWPLLLARA